MTRAPDPHDTSERLDEQARALHAALEEKEAVLTRIKQHVAVWLQDKRMRIAGEILLRDIERIENEERSARERRG